MSSAIHCFDILLQDRLPDKAPRVALLYGEPFLCSSTAARLLEHWGIDAEDAHQVDGEEAAWVDIHDELATPSLFSDAIPCVVVSRAAALITAFRAQLEHWADSAAADSLLILQSHTAPGNTKLGKQIAKNGLLVDCRLPTTSPRSKAVDLGKVKQWLVKWGDLRYGLKLTSAQAGEVLDAIGMECGLLDQEVAKLSLYADDDGKLSAEALRNNVGNWRTRTAFEIADAVAAGNVADALRHLDHLLAAGESPAAVFPQVAWSLRRYSLAAHLLLQARRTSARLAPRQALAAAGFFPAQIDAALSHLKRMGLHRASMIVSWLLELDLKLKGSHSNDHRAKFALEEFCLRLA